jgi:hypothetical protein
VSALLRRASPVARERAPCLPFPARPFFSRLPGSNPDERRGRQDRPKNGGSQEPSLNRFAAADIVRIQVLEPGESLDQILISAIMRLTLASRQWFSLEGAGQGLIGARHRPLGGIYRASEFRDSAGFVC